MYNKSRHNIVYLLVGGDKVYLLTKVVLAIMLGFITSTLVGLVIVPLLKRMKVGQKISSYMDFAHRSKEGTPTMGGFIFIISTLLVMAILLITGKVSSNSDLMIGPDNHEINFMTLSDITISPNNKNIIAFSHNDYDVEPLTVFNTLVYQGLLRIDSVSDLVFIFVISWSSDILCLELLFHILRRYIIL